MDRILPGYPGLYSSSRDADFGFEQQIFPSVNSRLIHICTVCAERVTNVSRAGYISFIDGDALFVTAAFYMVISGICFTATPPSLEIDRLANTVGSGDDDCAHVFHFRKLREDTKLNGYALRVMARCRGVVDCGMERLLTVPLTTDELSPGAPIQECGSIAHPMFPPDLVNESETRMVRRQVFVRLLSVEATFVIYKAALRYPAYEESVRAIVVGNCWYGFSASNKTCISRRIRIQMVEADVLKGDSIAAPTLLLIFQPICGISVTKEDVARRENLRKSRHIDVAAELFTVYCSEVALRKRIVCIRNLAHRSDIIIRKSNINVDNDVSVPYNHKIHLIIFKALEGKDKEWMREGPSMSNILRCLNQTIWKETDSTNQTDMDQPSFIAISPATRTLGHRDPILEGVQHQQPNFSWSLSHHSANSYAYGSEASVLNTDVMLSTMRMKSYAVHLVVRASLKKARRTLVSVTVLCMRRTWPSYRS
ncbi:hypothetical protein CLF_100483 [Clonorchis sinensis]|uniref:Uncharacterized protein n=1 Tax=Clonorchis sinensis TaxID=79923 RepID=G7Y3J9_CLOSI|nr:hypothetical protein CLF_100483 [Clonorchis sinensis]